MLTGQTEHRVLSKLSTNFSRGLRTCVLCLQDACKVVTYWLLRKYDIFQINSCTLVNVRGAQTFNENPLARQSAGAVEVGAHLFGSLFFTAHLLGMARHWHPVQLTA